MIAVDTNILLRFLVTGDPRQHAVAADFMRARTASDPAFISLVVLVETIWTLRRVHRLEPNDIHRAMSALLSTDDIVFESRNFVATLFVGSTAGGSDIADQIIAHVAERHGCAHTVTFDRCAAKAIPSMHLLT